MVGLGLLLCVPQDAEAIKAYPRPVTITQPDGTKITVRIHGDESFHYTTTIDGFMLERDKTGFFRYVNYDFNTGVKTLSAQRARNVGERTAEEKTFVANLKAAQLITADMKNTPHADAQKTQQGGAPMAQKAADDEGKRSQRRRGEQR